MGTDGQQSFVGIPAIGIPGLPIELPEIKLASRNTQMGTAKLGFVCYDAKSGESLGSGGSSTALTHNNDTYVMGVGPFRSGSVLDQREKAVGFNGVGGSFMSNPVRVARGTPVHLVDGSSAAPNPNVPQIATLPLQIYRLMGAYQMQAAAGGALLLLLLSMGAFWLLDRGGRWHAET